MRLLCFLVIAIGFTNISYTQILEPVKWATEYKQVSDTEFDLIYTAKIDDKWSIYSQYLEGDDGPIPTSFTYDEGDHFNLVGKNEESGNRKESFDKVFEMNLIKFSKTAIFTQRVSISDFSKPITGYLTFMTCDDTRCLPPTDVDFNFKPKKAASGSSDTGASDQPAKAVEKVAEAEPEVIPENIQEADQSESGGLLEPVIWSISANKKSEGQYEVVFTANIDDGWFVYSQFLESDDGPIATSFTYEEGDHFELIGKNEESGNRKKSFDEVFEMNLTKFKNMAIFTQQVEIKDINKPLYGYLTFMTCDNRRCLPPQDVDFFMNASTLQAYVADEAINQIKALTETSPVNLLQSGDLVDQARPTIIETANAPLGDCGGENTQGAGLFMTFIFGFIGGLIALLTP